MSRTWYPIMDEQFCIGCLNCDQEGFLERLVLGIDKSERADNISMCIESTGVVIWGNAFLPVEHRT